MNNLLGEILTINSAVKHSKSTWNSTEFGQDFFYFYFQNLTKKDKNFDIKTTELLLSKIQIPANF